MTARNLGTIDRDIGQPWSRVIQEAFSDGIIGDIHLSGSLFIGGAVIGAQGAVFFVDAYSGNDSNNGLSWDKAFKTIKVAAAASNVIIAQSGKGEWRNTIFCRGRFSEDLTSFGEKVDLIGVGSMDAMSRPRLTGHHALAAGIGNSTRFINWEFYPDSAAAIFTFTDCYGIEFHNCIFTNTEDYDTVHALVFTGTACHEITIANCMFRNDSANDPFETAAIWHNCTYGFGLIIKDCYIEGDIGIDIDTPTIWRGNLIANNVIKAETFPIDDESDDMVTVNNRMITAGDGTTLETVLDINLALSAGNILTSSNGCVEVPAFTTYA